MKVLNVIVLSILISILSIGSTFSQNESKHFKLLLIIKPAVDLPEFSLSRTTISAESIAAITESYTIHFPKLTATITDSTVTIETKVVVSDKPIRAVAGNKSGAYLEPQNIVEDVAAYSFPGQYDCIQVIYSLASIPNIAWGLTFPGSCYSSEMNYAGICTIANFNSAADYRNPASNVHEVFLHEWLHTLEAYYYNVLGVTNPPEPGHLDAAGNLCYTNLVKFYADHLNGTMHNYCVNPPAALPGTGFGPKAWQYPSPREFYGAFNDETLEPSAGMVAENLILNPSFEKLDGRDMPQNWSTWKFFNDNAVSYSVDNQIKTHGIYSAHISNNPNMNLSSFNQEIKVEPNTTYVFMGKMKTKNVIAFEGSHNIGGAFILTHDLMGWGTVNQIMGTNDWKRFAILYNSRNDNSVIVRNCLGHWSSAATGDAWFDDLFLVKLKDFELVASSIIDNIADKKAQNQNLVVYTTNHDIIIENLENNIEKIYLYDILGRMLKSVETSHQNKVIISADNLPKGILLINATGNKIFKTAKFVNF
jgi:hypothetical protein